MFDIIGDIHGYADELKLLLGHLGYHKDGQSYRHPARTAIFVGDFIDRGPRIRETLEIVRSMVDGGAARAVMGNHEYNAICFHTPDGKGSHLRPQSPKNIHQHQATLDALNHSSDLKHYLDWFKSLPLWLELKGLRVVHACWDRAEIATLQGSNRLTRELLFKSKDTPEHQAIEVLLKGKEVKLPDGVGPIVDAEGTARSEMRVKWWLTGEGQTYRSLAMPDSDLPPDLPVTEEIVRQLGDGYPALNPPVFFGHYWLPGDMLPGRQAPNVGCTDYSVAQRGKLMAYRWDGEPTIDPSHFTSGVGIGG